MARTREEQAAINMACKYHPTSTTILKALCDCPEVCLGDIDTSAITDMEKLFASIERKDFNGIERWDVSHVTDMSFMFWGCTHFNQDLSGWDVSQVTNMQGMFRDCENFNQPLNDWDISHVTDLHGMFKGCKRFNQPLGRWDISSVTDLACMFFDCENFAQNLSDWDISNVESLNGIFAFCPSLQHFPHWEITGRMFTRTDEDRPF